MVGKDELMARAWPRISVDEGNLKFQICALRRTLGDGHGGSRYLTTIPGRGYSFVAPLRLAEDFAPPSPQAEPSRPHNLRTRLTRLIGRAEIVEKLASQLPRQRLVTIAGSGGIGKTSVALAVAEALIPAYAHGVWLINLAPLSDPRLVPSVLTAALGLEMRSEDPVPGLIGMIRDKRMLLVLDNCEHVIDEAAALAVAVLGGTAGVDILATSREPLRVEGERVFRLSPLPSPPAPVGLTAAEALRIAGGSAVGREGRGRRWTNSN